MANLLPPFARKQLVYEYWTRVSSVFLLTLSVAIAAGMIMFIPTYVHISAQLDAMQASIHDAEVEQQRFQEASNELQVTNRFVQLLRQVNPQPSFLYYYDILTSIAGTAVVVEHFTVSREGSGQIERIDVQAVARTRQVLINFLDALNVHPEFGRVEVPIASLSQAENISFNLAIPVALVDNE